MMLMPSVHKVANSQAPGASGIAIFSPAGIIHADMKITVIGPGAIGMLVGALLQEGGHDVSFRGRAARARTARAIRLVLPDGWITNGQSAWPGPEESDGSPDLVLVALGRHHLHSVRRPDFLRMAGTGEWPVAFFNTGGPDAGRLGIAPGRQRLCLSLLTAVSLRQGEVELAPGKAVIVHERSPVLADCFSVLPRHGIQVIAVDDARPLANSLLLLQLLSLPVAMCNTTLDSFLSATEGRQLAANVLAEGFSAMEKAGLPVAPLPVMDPRELLGRINRRGASFSGASSNPDRAYNSVLQSFLRGQPTEASHINRSIVDIASSAGVRLTWNWRLVQKSSRVSGLGFYRDPAELLHSLE
jgi:ketopantoate reductase